MGNREALLVGARRCIDQSGLARTTARDVAAESGVSLAAIGYHFGSTEALLREAVFAGLSDWGAVLDEAVTATAAAAPDVRLATVWDRLISSFAQYRGVLSASYELAAQTSENDQAREQLAEALERTRRALARTLSGVDPDAEPERAHRLGAAHYAILTGVLTQWLADPAATPRGAELAAAIVEIGDSIGQPASAPARLPGDSS
jgi:AcrR family transcriptional regulator